MKGVSTTGSCPIEQMSLCGRVQNGATKQVTHFKKKKKKTGQDRTGQEQWNEKEIHLRWTEQNLCQMGSTFVLFWFFLVRLVVKRTVKCYQVQKPAFVMVRGCVSAGGTCDV